MFRRTFLVKAAAAWVAAAFTTPPIMVRPAKAGTKARHHRVEITGFVFEPSALKVSPGDTVTWTNRDIAPHTATANDGSWDTGELVKDAEASITVQSDTSSDYFCAFHPMMKGQLIVQTAD